MHARPQLRCHAPQTAHLPVCTSLYISDCTCLTRPKPLHHTEVDESWWLDAIDLITAHAGDGGRAVAEAIKEQLKELEM